jgi:transcriptional regulator with XRE-family HTH domain
MPETNDSADLADKVKRLVEERGWNQEEFARIARLNRRTVRQILGSEPRRRLRNATVNACARALGLTVNELRGLPVERLLPRMIDGGNSPDEILRQKYAEMTQPELKLWVERNPDRARHLTPDELDELLAMQGSEGPLAAFGVEAFVGRIERRRKLVKQLHVLAGTEYLDLLEQLVTLLYEKVRPPGHDSA